MRELPPADLVAGVKRSGVYAKGLWVRLNGGGNAGLGDALPLELPKPVSSKVGFHRTFADIQKISCAIIAS